MHPILMIDLARELRAERLQAAERARLAQASRVARASRAVPATRVVHGSRAGRAAGPSDVAFFQVSAR